MNQINERERERIYSLFFIPVHVSTVSGIRGKCVGAA
jgi:hypothetical protein